MTVVKEYNNVSFNSTACEVKDFFVVVVEENVNMKNSCSMSMPVELV